MLTTTTMMQCCSYPNDEEVRVQTCEKSNIGGADKLKEVHTNTNHSFVVFVLFRFVSSFANVRKSKKTTQHDADTKNDKQWTFKFNRTFGLQSTQTQIFDEISGLVSLHTLLYRRFDLYVVRRCHITLMVCIFIYLKTKTKTKTDSIGIGRLQRLRVCVRTNRSDVFDVSMFRFVFRLFAIRLFALSCFFL